MTIIVDPDNPDSTHHIKFLDASNNAVGLILRSGGVKDVRAIERRPRQNGQYSPFTQNDWGGGRGIKEANSDRTRFYDSKRAITRHPGMVTIGGQETFTTGVRDMEQYMPGKLTWQSLLTTERYIAYKVTASATSNRSAIHFWIRRRGTPTSTLTVELCSNNAGVPGSVLKTVTATTTNITDTVSQLYAFVFSSVQAVTATTLYWIKIYTSSADSSTNYWQVGTDAARTNALTYCSSDNGVVDTWAAATYDLYFRLVDDYIAQNGGHFFMYKKQLYYVRNRYASSQAAKLFINGDRGVCTGVQTDTAVKDSSKTWTTNEWAGCVLLLVSGTGSSPVDAYRTIASNTSDTLTVSSAFQDTPVAADTTYVILGSSKWTEITAFANSAYGGNLVTDVLSVGDVVYFAKGDAVQIAKMQETLVGTTWTRSLSLEDNYAKFMVSFRHPTKGLSVGKVNDLDNTGEPSFYQTSFNGYDQRLNFPILISNCESATNWTAGTGATVGTDTTYFMTGAKSIKVAVASGPANPVVYYAFPANAWMGKETLNRVYNIAGQRQVRFWIRTDANCAAGALKIFFSTSATADSTIEDLDIPALIANQWLKVVLPLDGTLDGYLATASMGLRVTAATGNYWIDGIEIVADGTEVPLGNGGEKITGLELYGDPEVPWIFRTQSAGSIENGTYNPIPLREMTNAESAFNGTGHVVHNVYLYFSFLHGLERFYRNNLDDVGPNRDEGLPSTRRGYITSMRGYVGRFFENYDAGASGNSSIMESTNGTDHHETYRCDIAGQRIRNLFIQVIPGDTADRLWFNQGEDVLWIPLPGSTLKEDTDTTFRYTHEAVLETGWITGAENDSMKLFHSVKLFIENATANRVIEWDYKTDDASTWTVGSTFFTTPTVQTVTLNISAKQLKLRFRLQTNDNTVSPVIRSMTVSATTRPETRYSYSMTIRSDDAEINLVGEESTTTANAILTQLDTWTTNNTILTMSSVFSSLNNKQVFLEPVVITPFSIVLDEGSEKYSMTISVIEP